MTPPAFPGPALCLLDTSVHRSPGVVFNGHFLLQINAVINSFLVPARLELGPATRERQGGSPAQDTEARPSLAGHGHRQEAVDLQVQRPLLILSWAQAVTNFIVCK